MDTDRSERRWDIPASLLLLLALLFAAGRLAVTDWVPHLTYTLPLVLLGGLLGLALGGSRFSGRTAFALALAYTLLIVPWQVSFIIQGASDWTERLVSLGGRFLLSMGLLAREREVSDYVLFLGVMCLVFWGLAVYSGYSLNRRRDAARVLLPAGLAIVVMSVYDYYAADRMAYLAFYLFIGLALIGRLNYLHNRRDWEARRVYLSPEVSTDLTLSILITAAFVVVVTWAVPLSVKEFRSAAQFWSDAAQPLKGIRARLQDAFAAVRQPVPTAGRDYYEQSLSLGTGSTHSQAVLFTVKAPAEALNLPRLYWRGVVYDRYDDGEWASTAPGSAVFRPADQRLPLADYETLPAARYTFTSNTGGRLLYTPTSAVWVSRASNLRYFPVEVRSMDIQSILAQQLFLRGETYYVRAPLRNPTVADLRAAPRNYPDWVTQTYLQLPEDLPPEIEQLAEEITRDGVNPYDRALAITNYLRGGMVYMERIPSPPASSDPIAWFLFEGKQGFCNYYASAEVLMLRSIGIPARLVAGFSQGEKNSTGSTFTVRDKNAHAWPEAYFPGFGWIEFEPTANQPALARPPGLTRLGTGPLTPVAPPQGELRPDPVDLEVPAGRPTPVGPNIAAVAAWLVGLVVAVVLFVSLRRRGPNRPPVVRQASVGLRDFLKARNLPAPAWLDDWVLWLQMPAIEQSFQAINQALSWLGRQQPVHATPAERAATLQRILPEADQPIGSLLEELHAHVFSPKPGNVARATHAARRVRYLALRRWVSRLFKRDKT